MSAPKNHLCVHHLPLVGRLLDLLGIGDGQIVTNHLQLLGHGRVKLDPAVPVILRERGLGRSAAEGPMKMKV